MRAMLIVMAMLAPGCVGTGATEPDPDPATAGSAERPGGGASEPDAAAEAAEADPAVEAEAEAEAAPPLPHPEEVRIKALFAEQRITIDFEDAPVATVLNYLRMQTGVNLVIDPAALAKLEANDNRVNLQVEAIPVQSALNILLEFTGLTTTFTHGVLWVHDPAAAAPAVVVPPAPGPAAIEAKLDTVRVSPNFNDTPLTAVVGFFGDVSGVEVLLAPEVTAQVPNGPRVSLQVSNITLREALGLCLAMSDLTYRYDGEVLVIAPNR